MRLDRLAILVIGLAVIACDPLDQPAYQVDLSDSSWSLVTIDGKTVGPSHASITFGEPAVIETGVRTLRLSNAMDTDGSALSFDLPTTTAPPCPTGLLRQDAAVTTALAGIEAWSVTDLDHIILHGDHEIGLTRQP